MTTFPTEWKHKNHVPNHQQASVFQRDISIESIAKRCKKRELYTYKSTCNWGAPPCMISLFHLFPGPVFFQTEAPRCPATCWDLAQREFFGLTEKVVWSQNSDYWLVDLPLDILIIVVIIPTIVIIYGYMMGL
jgi:hypothetical protein